MYLPVFYCGDSFECGYLNQPLPIIPRLPASAYDPVAAGHALFCKLTKDSFLPYPGYQAAHYPVERSNNNYHHHN
jgi:hypothetical protein